MRIGVMVCRAVLFGGLAFGAPVQIWGQATPLDAAKAFTAAFDAGDNPKAAALMSAHGLVIVDEIAPFLWTGNSSFADWIADYDKDAKAKVLTDPKVTLGEPLVNTIKGDTAYLICTVTYTFKAKGVAMREPARMAMTLHKEGEVWRFTSYTWTGTVPKVVAQ